jgi:inner membrane protein
VHPFWPIDRHWSYGDTLFIVEPWVWVIFLPFLFFGVENLIGKAVAIAILAAAIGLEWFSGFVLPTMALFITLTAAFSILIHWKFPKKTAHGVMWACFLIVLCIFYKTSVYTKEIVERVEDQERPGIIIHDTVLSPLPSNFFCWRVQTVESLGPMKTYRVRDGLVTPFPGWVDFTDCSKLAMSKHSKGLQVNPKNEVHWFREKLLDLSVPQRLEKEDCDVKGLLRFSRVPVFEKTGKGMVKFYDARFEREGRTNFTEVIVPEFPLIKSECPGIPSWIPPREDLLTGK